MFNSVQAALHRLAKLEIVPVDRQQFVGEDGVVEPIRHPDLGGNDPPAGVFLHRAPSVDQPAGFDVGVNGDATKPVERCFE